MTNPVTNPADKSNGLRHFTALLDGDTGDLSAFDPPLFWPGLAAEDAAAEWEALRRWVARLAERFDLDFHALPRCWYRHNNYIEALCALRDHERASYADTAAPTAALEWHRAFRDIEGRLREWAGRSACGAQHEPSAPRQAGAVDDDWSAWVADDIGARRNLAVAAALVEPSD